MYESSNKNHFYVVNSSIFSRSLNLKIKYNKLLNFSRIPSPHNLNVIFSTQCMYIGTVAACVSSVSSYQKRHYFYDDDKGNSLVCAVDELGVGFVMENKEGSER